MRASPPERRSRECCCATTLSINTGLWICRWSPSWESAAGGLTLHVLCGIECLSGVRSSYPQRAFQGTGHTRRSHPPPAQRAGRPPDHRCTAASSASRSDTRSLASAVPVGGRLAIPVGIGSVLFPRDSAKLVVSCRSPTQRERERERESGRLSGRISIMGPTHHAVEMRPSLDLKSRN
jgi:hypothetical protein